MCDLARNTISGGVVQSRGEAPLSVPRRCVGHMEAVFHSHVTSVSKWWVPRNYHIGQAVVEVRLRGQAFAKIRLHLFACCQKDWPADHGGTERGY